jgi:hypothetical protein
MPVLYNRTSRIKEHSYFGHRPEAWAAGAELSMQGAALISKAILVLIE